MLSSVALHAGELLAAGLLAGAVFVAVMAAGAVPGSGPEPASGEVSSLVSAAGQIQAAASAALESVSRPAARHLADDVRMEVVALAAGLASAAGTDGPPRSAR